MAIMVTEREALPHEPVAANGIWRPGPQIPRFYAISNSCTLARRAPTAGSRRVSLTFARPGPHTHQEPSALSISRPCSSQSLFPL